MTGISEKALTAARLVLAKCSAIDPWFPEPSESTMLGWAEQFGLVNFDTQELLDAVSSVYARATSGFKPLPADVINAARLARQDRTARTPIESDADEVYPGDVKAAADPGDYPHEWTAEQRVSAYWYANSLRAMPATTAGWRALADQLERERERHEKPAGTGGYGNLLTVRCPWCHASPGQHCTVPQTKRRPHGGAHPSRIEAAEAARA